MTNEPLSKAIELADIAQTIKDSDKNLILIYAFNGTGKTRLSVAFKDLTKSQNDGNHAGVYYNAYSEDLFYWDNDEENNSENMRLIVQKSSLNQYHSLFDENNLRSKLSLYKPRYDFVLRSHADTAFGIESIQFFEKTETVTDDIEFIKISRGEEQTFIWCFFLALFEVESWVGQRSNLFLLMILSQAWTIIISL